MSRINRILALSGDLFLLGRQYEQAIRDDSKEERADIENQYILKLAEIRKEVKNR